MNLREYRYGGRTVTLADLPRYRKFYAKLESGRWEPHTFALLARHLDPGTVFLDIGAWIGVTPFWASGLAKKVIAVEPDPECRAILKELLPRYPNVTLIEGALSPDAIVAIHAVEGFGSSETSVLDIGDGGSLDVPGVRIEALLEAAGPHPVFVKVDVEGYEFPLVGEFEKLGNIKGIVIAVHPQLYQRSLNGPISIRRLRTAAAVLRLHRALSRSLPNATIRKYRGLTHYILSGLLFRREPAPTDFVFLAGGGGSAIDPIDGA